MGFRRQVMLVALNASVSFCQLVNGQDENAGKVLELPETAQIEFVTATIDQGFPAEKADQMTMLILNRGVITLPLIEERLIQAVIANDKSREDFIAIASEMISYAGGIHSLRIVKRLMTLDENRFGYLIGRTLDNALERRNPFSVAYAGLELGDIAVTRRIIDWSGSVIESKRMRQLWGEAVAEKYGRSPTSTEWGNDPLASRLIQGEAKSLTLEVLRFAEESRAKR